MLLKPLALLSLAAGLAWWSFGLWKGLLGFLAAWGLSFLVMLLAWTLSCLLCTALVDLEEPSPKHSPIHRFFTNGILDTARTLLRVKLQVTGREKLPRERFLLVCNHRSALDPMLEMLAFRDCRMGFVAKQELFRIPVAGKLMHKCFCFALDRGSLRDGLKTMEEAASVIQSGEACVGIYPEGTRSPDGTLLPFHNGSFKIAQRAQCPIVVAVIQNTEQICKRAPWQRTEVTIQIAGVLGAAEVTQAKTARLSARVRRMMERALEIQKA